MECMGEIGQTISSQILLQRHMEARERDLIVSDNLWLI